MSRPPSITSASQISSSEESTIHTEPIGDDVVDPWLVTFDENDPYDPKNISNVRKWYLTAFSGLLLLNATFASSAPAGVIEQLVADFKLSGEVATLTIALFVAGYCVGPLLWGPLSEQYGRRPIFIVAFVIYTIFQVAMAVSNSTAQILIFRFLGGTFAACPLTNSGALIADVWDARTRGKALAIFTVAPFAGPSLGPAVSGFMSVAGVSWRWTFWVLTFFAGACLVAIVLTVPETYAPVLLVHKAQKLRKETGDARYYAHHERTRRTFGKQIEHILARPFKVLFTEPMLMACTIYMSFVYGCIYLLFEAYPIVFTQGHHFNVGISGLMFLPIMFGGIAAVTIYSLVWNPRYERLAAQYAPRPVPPEYRLEMTRIAAPLFAVAFFWFGWTSYPSISFWAPMMAGGLMGFSISWIFLSLFNYIIDSYLAVAASALAGSTVVRSLFGAGFPLFATQMYEKLDARWASTLLGCISLLMTPIPFIFMKYGARIRLHSKYAPSPPPDQLPVDLRPEDEKNEVA